MAVEIHPTAVISSGAEIGDGTTIGAYSIVGPKVKLGASCTVAPHVVLEGNLTLGDRNTVYQFASLGSAPQDLKYRGEPSTVEIGNDNIIREYVTIQPGTSGGGMRTIVGDRNLFMVSSHIGHDSVVGSDNVFANCAAVAGHVTIGNRVILGGLSAVHQFVRLGDLCFIAGMTGVVSDIPPFCMAQGRRADLVGLNLVGLERAKLSSEDISLVKKLYKLVFRGKGLLKERLARAEQECGSSEYCQQILTFVKSAERGVASVRMRTARENE